MPLTPVRGGGGDISTSSAANVNDCSVERICRRVCLDPLDKGMWMRLAKTIDQLKDEDEVDSLLDSAFVFLKYIVDCNGDCNGDHHNANKNIMEIGSIGTIVNYLAKQGRSSDRLIECLAVLENYDGDLHNIWDGSSPHQWMDPEVICRHSLNCLEDVDDFLMLKNGILLLIDGCISGNGGGGGDGDGISSKGSLLSDLIGPIFDVFLEDRVLRKRSLIILTKIRSMLPSCTIFFSHIPSDRLSVGTLRLMDAFYSLNEDFK